MMTPSSSYLTASSGLSICAMVLRRCALNYSDMTSITTPLGKLAKKIERGVYRFGKRKLLEIPKSTPGEFRLVQKFSPTDALVARFLSQILTRRIAHHIRLIAPDTEVQNAATLARSGFLYVRRFDFEDYFTSISRTQLLHMLSGYGFPLFIQDLIESYLYAPVVDDDGNVIDMGGIPQGGSLSPILAALYSLPIRVALESYSPARLLLYVDDGLLAATSSSELSSAEIILKSEVDKLELKFKRSKDWQGRFDSDDGVPFLGFRIRHDAVTIQPSRVSRFRAKLRSAVRQSRTFTLKEAIAKVNRVACAEVEVDYKRVGWIRYYSKATDLRQFLELDRSLRDTFRGCFGSEWSNRRLENRGLICLWNRSQLFQRKYGAIKI
jgi:hypothetical protein